MASKFFSVGKISVFVIDNQFGSIDVNVVWNSGIILGLFVNRVRHLYGADANTECDLNPVNTVLADSWLC